MATETCLIGYGVHTVAIVEYGVPLMQPKWDQPLGPPRRRTRHGLKLGDGPPHLLAENTTKLYRDPGKGVGGLQVHPLPVAAPAGRPPGTVIRQAAGVPPGPPSVPKRIRSPTWAEDTRRLGVQEEGRTLSHGRWGCQFTIPTFPKG